VKILHTNQQIEVANKKPLEKSRPRVCARLVEKKKMELAGTAAEMK